MTSGLLGRLDALIALLEGAKGPLAPLISYDPKSPAAAQAFVTMAADPPARIEALRNTYINNFGFEKKPNQEPIQGETIREPRIGVEQGDLAVVQAVGAAMKLRPAHVLALWIVEGKGKHNATLHSKLPNLFLGVIPLSAHQDPAQAPKIAAFMRSMLLWDAFGADRYIAHMGAQTDHKPLDFTAPHAAKFAAALTLLETANAPGLGTWDKALRNRIVAYFTNSGGGMTRDVTVDLANALVELRVGVAPGSLASWVWLQDAMFWFYRLEQEAFLVKTYGSCPDLTDLPWVTYTHWNASPATSDPWFTGAADAQAAIDALFGAPGVAPAKLPAVELDRYYHRDPQHPASALVNAVTVKYLCEAVEPWFA